MLCFSNFSLDKVCWSTLLVQRNARGYPRSVNRVAQRSWFGGVSCVRTHSQGRSIIIIVGHNNGVMGGVVEGAEAHPQNTFTFSIVRHGPCLFLAMSHEPWAVSHEPWARPWTTRLDHDILIWTMKRKQWSMSRNPWIKRIIEPSVLKNDEVEQVNNDWLMHGWN